MINPFRYTPSTYSLITLIYFLLLSFLWLWNLSTSVKIINEAIEMESFYTNQLKITVNELQVIKWHDVIDRFISVHDRNGLDIKLKNKLTAHDIVLRIMRKENYLIGLISKSHLDLSMPSWLSSITTKQLFLTKSLEWSISFCIVEYMFNENNEISHDFLDDINGLKWRFQLVGIINFLLLPFMLVFMTIHFFLQNAQLFHANKAYLGPRQWTPLALWRFREYNELPHVFERRMNKAYGPANDYLASFHNPFIAILARFSVFIIGGLLSTLLLISFVSEGALLYVHVADHNLLWFLGVFSAIFAAIRGFIPEETMKSESYRALLTKVCLYTHYYPDSWVGKAHSPAVHAEVAQLFQYKIQVFFTEVLSVLITPIVLYLSFPHCVDNVLNFIR